MRKLKGVKQSGWYVAIRKKQGAALYEGNTSAFAILKQSIRYWYADPFLFDYCGRTFLFVEEYDRLKKKGRISVTEIIDGTCKQFLPCLEFEEHLSYPCIYAEKEIYMIPECYQSGKVVRFKCVDFPLVWMPENTLFEGEAADTTPLYLNQSVYYITTVFKDKNNRKNDNLMLLCDGTITKLLDSSISRCAGHVLHTKENEMIRPVQDCSISYGKHLYFKSIIFDGKEYNEKEKVCVTYPGDPDKTGKIEIVLDRTPKGTFFTGIHTYNSSHDYEVVDLKYYSVSIINIATELFFMLLNKLYILFDKERI